MHVFAVIRSIYVELKQYRKRIASAVDLGEG